VHSSFPTKEGKALDFPEYYAMLELAVVEVGAVRAA